MDNKKFRLKIYPLADELIHHFEGEGAKDKYRVLYDEKKKVYRVYGSDKKQISQHPSHFEAMVAAFKALYRAHY